MYFCHHLKCVLRSLNSNRVRASCWKSCLPLMTSQHTHRASPWCATTAMWGTLTSKVRDVRCITGLILGLRPANERRRYFVTTSLIGRVQAYNQPCSVYSIVSVIGCLTHLSMRCSNHVTNIFFKLILRQSLSWSLPLKLVSDECHRTLLMISQHWSR